MWRLRRCTPKMRPLQLPCLRRRLLQCLLLRMGPLTLLPPLLLCLRTLARLGLILWGLRSLLWTLGWWGVPQRPRKTILPL